MAETAPASAAAPAKGRNKLLLIGGPVLLVVLGAAAWFLFLAPGDEGDDAAETPETTVLSEEPGVIVQVDETTVSLGGAEPHFAAVTYSAVLSAEVVDQGAVEAEFPRLRSRAQLVFRTYDHAELDTPAGFEQLQQDLTAVARELWPDGEVIEVLVESLLVQ